jgi:hypothetical protein
MEHQLNRSIESQQIKFPANTGSMPVTFYEHKKFNQKGAKKHPQLFTFRKYAEMMKIITEIKIHKAEIYTKITLIE